MNGQESLTINTGIKRIMVNDDPDRVIVFNPEDILFVERFYALIKTFEVKEVDFKTRFAIIDKDKTVDEYGLPLNTDKRIKLVREVTDYLKGEIDKVFGAGTSQTAFGDAVTLDMFAQFFTGILPFIEKSRAKKLAKYKK